MKTAVINNELMRLNVDIAALQDTRLGTLKENDKNGPESMEWALQ